MSWIASNRKLKSVETAWLMEVTLRKCYFDLRYYCLYGKKCKVWLRIVNLWNSQSYLGNFSWSDTRMVPTLHHQRSAVVKMTHRQTNGWVKQLLSIINPDPNLHPSPNSNQFSPVLFCDGGPLKRRAVTNRNWVPQAFNFGYEQQLMRWLQPRLDGRSSAIRQLYAYCKPNGVATRQLWGTRARALPQLCDIIHLTRFAYIYERDEASFWDDFVCRMCTVTVVSQTDLGF